MTLETSQSLQAARMRKLALSMIGGAALGGAVVAFGLVPLLKTRLLTDPGAIAAAGVGLIYVLMGLIVGLGALFPGAGAKVLNVPDREELEDQRAMLLGGAFCYLAFGAALILLALAGPGGPVPASLALAGLAGSFALSCLITWLQWDKYDELSRQVSLESGSIGFLIVLPILTLWGAANHLGFVASFSPLAVIAVLALAVVLGAFIAAGRRSLLTQG